MSLIDHIAWAETKHIDAMLPLMLALYADDPTVGHQPTEDSAAQHLQVLLTPSTPHRLAVAFDQDGAAIGLAAIGFFTSINESHPDRRKQIELKELFVLPALRSGGVGLALMKWVEDQARSTGVHRIDWHVKAANTRGIDFYQRLGGGVVTDRLSMRKVLHRD